jgi:hypothetical protein
MQAYSLSYALINSAWAPAFELAGEDLVVP